MGTFSFSTKRDVDAEALTFSVNIADADVDRVTTALAATHFTSNEGVVPSGADVMQVAAQRMVRDLLQLTLAYEKQQAAKIAIENVAEIKVESVS